MTYWALKGSVWRVNVWVKRMLLPWRWGPFPKCMPRG